MIRELTELAPDARAVAQAYLDSAADRVAADDRDAVVDDLRLFLCEHLTPAATVADVNAVIEQAGPVPAEARTPCQHLRDLLSSGFDPRNAATRIATTWWNPADERLFLPRAIGWGWDLNFGALAVRLGLIEADAESEPFSATPDRVFVAATAVPAARAAATVLHYAFRGRSLPAQLPAHWDIAGAPDRWMSRRRAAVTDLAMTLVPAIAAAGAARSRQPGPARAGVLAAAGAVGAGGAAVTVLRTLGDRPRVWTGPAIVLAIAGTAGGILLGLARAGRAAEIRRDLDREQD
nr:DUF1648 domain-containing protein [Propionicimonas sp.]